MNLTVLIQIYSLNEMLVSYFKILWIQFSFLTECVDSAPWVGTAIFVGRAIIVLMHNNFESSQLIIILPFSQFAYGLLLVPLDTKG